MADWKKLLSNVLLADGKIDAGEVAIISKEILADGKVDQEEVDFLVGLRNAAKSSTSEFDALFFDALSRNVLEDGGIDAAEAGRLRTILFADGKVDAGEKKFLQDLKSKATKTSPEFDRLYEECMR